MFQNLIPDRVVTNIADIDPSELYKSGVRLVSFDFDQTLGEYGASSVSETLAPILQKFVDTFPGKVCVISNKAKKARISNALKDWPITLIPAQRDKPSVEMFETAEKLFNTSKSECLHIGDRLLTDVLGAHRSGWQVIKVSPVDRQSDPFNIVLVRALEELLAKLL